METNQDKKNLKEIVKTARKMVESAQSLPSKLAQRFVDDIREAVERRNNYYVFVSGKKTKSHVMDDLKERIEFWPAGEVYTPKDLEEETYFLAPSIRGALWRLYSKCPEVDLVHMGGLDYFMRPEEENEKKSIPQSPVLSSEILQDRSWIDLYLIESFKKLSEHRKNGLNKRLEKWVTNLAKKGWKQVRPKMAEQLAGYGYINLEGYPLKELEGAFKDSHNNWKHFDYSFKNRRTPKRDYNSWSVHASGYIQEDGRRLIARDIMLNTGLPVATRNDKPFAIYDPKLIRDVRKRRLKERNI